jgi:hypothetical protein
MAAVKKPAAKKQAAKKRPEFVDGYYIAIFMEPAAILLFGPDTDLKVSKWYRKLVKDDGYQASEDDFAEVRWIEEGHDLAKTAEEIKPIEDVLAAYVDEDAEDDE